MPIGKAEPGWLRMIEHRNLKGDVVILGWLKLDRNSICCRVPERPSVLAHVPHDHEGQNDVLVYYPAGAAEEGCSSWTSLLHRLDSSPCKQQPMVVNHTMALLEFLTWHWLVGQYGSYLFAEEVSLVVGN